MNALSATGLFPKYHPLVLHPPKRRRSCSLLPPLFSILRAPPPLRESSSSNDDDVMQMFLKERESSGDFVAKICDGLWLKGMVGNSNSNNNNNNAGKGPLMEGIDGSVGFGFSSQSLEDEEEEENEGGFLKLKGTSEWLSGDVNSAPMNKKMSLKEVSNDSERRKRLNFLRYEALKKELLFMTVGIGTACSGYCLVTLSIQAAFSYAVGVLFSCLYFQLLCKHADNLSREMIPPIFTKKKTKKIGIRTEDLQDFFERSIKGSGLALSSPRLVIPAAIYGLWEVSQHFTHDILDFQIVPAMVGLFAYKAAALVQVYRDNEDLQFIFPDSKADGSSD